MEKSRGGCEMEGGGEEWDQTGWGWQSGMVVSIGPMKQLFVHQLKKFTS